VVWSRAVGPRQTVRWMAARYRGGRRGFRCLAATAAPGLLAKWAANPQRRAPARGHVWPQMEPIGRAAVLPRLIDSFLERIFSMFSRTAITIMISAGSALAVLGTIAPNLAKAQPVQSQNTAPPPIRPLHSSSGGLSSPKGAYGSAGITPTHSRSFHTRNGHQIVVPSGAPGHNTFQDRVSRCQRAGAAAGLGPSGQGAFTGQCS
jgi:hypothetical protein